MDSVIDEVQHFEIEKVSPVWLITSLCVVPFCLYFLLSFLSPLMNRMTAMKVSAIYVYPIKSLRELKVDEAMATRYGFRHDRSFMLLQKTAEGYKNMQVSRYPEMTLFYQEIEGYGSDNETLNIKYQPADNSEKSRTIKMPLLPNTDKLERFEVNMYGSPFSALKMSEEYCTWFSECFGYEVVLVYIGNNTRAVGFQDMQPQELSPFLQFLDKNVPFARSYVDKVRGLSLDEEWKITFADCAPYLIVSQTSLEDVSSRLPEGEEMDIRKFRPNIVVKGAFEPYEEDLWGKVKFSSGAEVIMAHNCVRCKSINVDFKTGKAGTGPSGEVLKKLQKDRRIDTGAKWSPVFGRYSFWSPRCASQRIRVGDRVNVVKINDEPTVWNWPNIG